MEVLTFATSLGAVRNGLPKLYTPPRTAFPLACRPVDPLLDPPSEIQNLDTVLAYLLDNL